MKHPLPARPELGTRDGLAYALFLPPVEPRAGVVICHGAGSAKESHFDFARAAVAYDMAALAFDARGHGKSDGRFGPGAIDDVLEMCGVMRENTARIALRGSSMGGFCAIHAAAADGMADAVVAICPAPEDFLLRGLRSGRLEDFEADRDALEPWLEGLSLNDAVASLAPRTALLLLHARGDEQVPYTVSEELFEAAGEPKRMLILPGGHHRSIQHDLELQAESLKFVERAVDGGRV
jgi:alpha-beta hydrolase superfamily lysophospholipase